MKITKNHLKALLTKVFKPKPKPQRILITWLTDKDGKPVTDIKMDKGVNANHAVTVLEQLGGSITNGIRDKVNEAGLRKPTKQQRAFIVSRTIGDIL